MIILFDAFFKTIDPLLVCFIWRGVLQNAHAATFSDSFPLANSCFVWACEGIQCRYLFHSRNWILHGPRIGKGNMQMGHSSLPTGDHWRAFRGGNSAARVSDKPFYVVGDVPLDNLGCSIGLFCRRCIFWVCCRSIRLCCSWRMYSQSSGIPRTSTLNFYIGHRTSDHYFLGPRPVWIPFKIKINITIIYEIM